MISSSGLSRTRTVRLLLATATVLAAVALSGCQVEGPYSVAKHLRPISSEMASLLEKKGMSQTSPLLIRIFKEEAELEIWKQDASGQYALLKVYPICRWSGQLGPKTRQGDRQAPEGFYAITPGQMNPNSSFYLSFNLGYPNAFDRAHGRSGAHLMVHGDCSSSGCYSMTDEQIAEIFALGRESFFAGQKSFQVQAYPFRMTPLNMAKHRNSPHMSFWKNIKEGYDHFELTRQEPKVDVCDKRYVFNAEAPAGSTTPLAFQPAGRCPAYQVPAETATAVADKQKRDLQAFASFVSRGTATVPVDTGRDGGMHPTFMAMYESREVRDAKGRIQGVAVERRSVAIGPVDYNPPPQVESRVAAVSTGTPANVPMPRPAPWRASATASINSRGGATAYTSSTTGTGQSGGFFTGLYSSSVGTVNSATASVKRVFGFGGEEAKPAPAAKSRPTRVARPTPAPAPVPTAAKPDAPKAVAAKPKPQEQASTEPTQAAQPRPAGAAGLLPGAVPVVPASNFENRFTGAAR